MSSPVYCKYSNTKTPSKPALRILCTWDTAPRLFTSCARELLARHDLREHLQRRCTPGHAPPHVRGNFMSRAEDAYVRERARVLVQTGGRAIDGEIREPLLRELRRKYRL